MKETALARSVEGIAASGSVCNPQREFVRPNEGTWRVFVVHVARRRTAVLICAARGPSIVDHYWALGRAAVIA